MSGLGEQVPFGRSEGGQKISLDCQNIFQDWRDRHAMEPTVRFHGHRSEGIGALAVGLEGGLPVHTLRRIWTIDDGEPTGPFWELAFN